MSKESIVVFDEAHNIGKLAYVVRQELTAR